MQHTHGRRYGTFVFASTVSRDSNRYFCEVRRFLPAGGAYAVLVRRQLAAGASQAESLASMDQQDDSSTQQTPSMESARPSSPRSDVHDGDAQQLRERAGSPDVRGHPPSPRKGGGRPPSPRRGATKPHRSTSMTRQDTGAIVDAVMADVVGGGFASASHPDSSPKTSKQSPDSPHDNGNV